MQKDPRTHAILGAAMEVHRILGPGYLEAVYHESLAIEFGLQKIPFTSEPRIRLYYKNQMLEKYYVPDFLVYDGVILELKAQSSLGVVDEAQAINSLRCTRKCTGLLVNFGESSLAWKRFIHTVPPVAPVG